MADRELIAAALPGYRLGQEAGRGAFGTVWSAEHRQMGRRVAIKLLTATDPHMRSRFLAEATVLASLDHPHIVPLYDYIEADDACLLVMEWLDGGTLARRFLSPHAVDIASACAVAMVTCDALHHAHQRGVLHRDVKPENLLFSAAGALKVTDFGIAKVVGLNTRTTLGMMKGTPAYMAPEQVAGDEPGPGVDIYATGILLYELLTGTLPFSEVGSPIAVALRHLNDDPAPLDRLAPEMAGPLTDVTMRAISRTAKDRFATAEQFGVAIGRAATKVLGEGWLDGAQIALLTSGRILDSAHVPAQPPTTSPRRRTVATTIEVPASSTETGKGQATVARQRPTVSSPPKAPAQSAARPPKAAASPPPTPPRREPPSRPAAAAPPGRPPGPPRGPAPPAPPPPDPEPVPPRRWPASVSMERPVRRSAGLIPTALLAAAVLAGGVMAAAAHLTGGPATPLVGGTTTTSTTTRGATTSPPVTTTSTTRGPYGSDSCTNPSLGFSITFPKNVVFASPDGSVVGQCETLDARPVGRDAGLVTQKAPLGTFIELSEPIVFRRLARTFDDITKNGAIDEGGSLISQLATKVAGQRAVTIETAITDDPFFPTGRTYTYFVDTAPTVLAANLRLGPESPTAWAQQKRLLDQIMSSLTLSSTSCHNSRETRCGEFFWNGDASSHALSVSASASPTQAKVGDTVTLEIQASSPDDDLLTCRPFFTGILPASSGHSDFFLPLSDEIRDRTTATAPYGPWSPPTRLPTANAFTFTHVYTAAGKFIAGATCAGGNSASKAAGDPYDPYASRGVGTTTVVVTGS